MTGYRFRFYPCDPADEADLGPFCTCSRCGDDIYDRDQLLFRLEDGLLCEDCFLATILDPAYIDDVVDAACIAEGLDVQVSRAEDIEAAAAQEADEEYEEDDDF